jgi:protease-4
LSGLNTFLSMLAVIIIISYIGAGISATYLQMGKQLGYVQLVGPIYSFGDVTDQIGYAEDDHRIKGVVLYVNSPGGSAYACMEIRRYVENMSKPNIAVIDELGASGAYYIASAADEIMAHANTLTGSIGVISIWEDYSVWLEKEGIQFHVWKSGDAKDLYEPWRSPTAEENETIQKNLDEIYDVLVEDIARGRPNLTEEETRKVANGSIYTGIEALDLGLVDELGDYRQAVEKVAERTNVRRYFTRDLALTDREVLAGLFMAYLVSGVTIIVAISLATIGIFKASIRRRERAGIERTRMHGV